MTTEAKALLRTAARVSEQRGDESTANEIKATLAHGAKPFGWEVDVLISDKMLKLEDTSERKTFHYRGSRSTAYNRALCHKHVWKVVEVRGIDEATWRRAYGDPENRGL